MTRLLPFAIAGCAAASTACPSNGTDAGPGPDGAATDAGGGTDAAGPAIPGTCALSTHVCDPAATARPGRRSEFAAAYDEQGHQLFVHGGSTAVSIMCSIPAPEFSDETWLYDDECGTWRLAAAAAGPGPRARHMAAYDSTARRVLVFGGRYRAGASGAYTLYDDVWAFDLATETWSMLAPGGVGAPPARNSGVVAFDEAGGRLWLFGGNASTSGAAYLPLQDTWSFDLAGGTWTLASAGAPDPAPSPRLLLGGAFDPVRGRFLVFSGADASAFSAAPIYWNDLWAYDTGTSSWGELHDGSGTAPDGRFFGAMAYDGVNDGYLVFAGHDDTALGNANDLWRFDPTGGAWTLLRRGDTFNEPFAGFCDPTVNFAVVDVEAPERRNAHGFVASTACGHALAFAGKSDCGATDDVWAWDLATGVWENPVEASEGEVCLRRMDGDPTNCQTLCL